MKISPRVRAALALVGLINIATSATAASRETTTPLEGLRDASPRVHALVGARIVTAPDKVIENGVLVIRDGVIEAVGAGITPPADARVWDVKGRTLFPGFIESDASLFLPAGWKSAAAAAAASAEADAPRPAPDATSATPAVPAAEAGARAWNSRVLPQRLASRALIPDPRGAEALRKLGFTVAHVTPARGIFRGQSALVSLGSGGFNRTVLRDAVLQPIAFETTTGTETGYPSSLMGSIALVRQTLLDAQWYADAHARAQKAGGSGIARPEANDALAALGAVVRAEQQVMVSLRDELDTERALRIANEFKLKLVLRGTGSEYRMMRAMPEKRVPVIVPLAFPEAPEVEDRDQALDFSLDRLEHWELAASNPAQLATAGVPIAFTSAGLRRPETEFWAGVRKAIQRGLPRATALAALTTTPAEILGVASSHGTLAAGKVANVVVASGDLFAADDAEIQLMWVDGDPFELEAWRRFDARGTWRVAWEGAKSGPAEIKITGRTATRLSATAAGSAATVRAENDQFTLLAPAKWFGLTEGTARLSAHTEGATLRGTGELPDGTAVRWHAERTAVAEASSTAERKPETLHARLNVFPAGAYGRTAVPEQPAAVLVKGATIWTSAAAGTLEGADLLIERGKITRVGRNLTPPAGATIIDAAGRHVSPGLIDCHSHLAIARGVNEGSHSVTVEVRVGDVIDATDVGIYRCLAGGLTTANILHGSANSMGGQNAVIKLRWGQMAEGLKFEGAAPGVKFALGENVTRKNTTPSSTRYPISRMGVREVMLDTFTRARDYERAWADFRANRTPLPPRRDLRLDAALEILRGERLIHIHSYRQDEILAFIRLAEELKLSVATFQHILEGYKVAPEIAKLGAGASSFSDWWAYKYEVIDAIPHNGALMRSAGIVVSFNSDSDELARRMNTEAAKAVKYGGVPPAEALKFVTLNPAKQLRIDARVGSLEPGKDADFVIWNASPLSTYARVEQTWIDGRRYFDREDDARLRSEAARLRTALVQKILPVRQRALAAAGPGGGAGGGSGEGAGGAEARPGILLLLEQLAAEHSGEMRGLYHDGGSAHNCSTHGEN